MTKQHTEDYKLSAVKYYLKYRDTKTHEQVCEIFNCSYRSLKRWIYRYQDTNIQDSRYSLWLFSLFLSVFVLLLPYINL